MKLFRFFAPLLLSILLIIFLNKSVGPAPPLGKFLSPFVGFWQNAKTGRETPYPTANIKGLHDQVNVFTDEHQVAHISAKNDYDLYFMQGYITARDRLWQMEFINFAATGRVSELIGEKGLEFDRTQRRLGLPYGAQQAMTLIDSDPLAKMSMTAYTAGVNAYINNLSDKDLPVEYKLLNYKPEQWSNYKTAVLLKFMAKLLTGNDNDFQYTNAINKFGRDLFEKLFPDTDGTDPIIPTGTKFDFTAVKVDTPPPFIPKGQYTSSVDEKSIDHNIGSNNWAVSGKKTATGSPILCNDPHLPLNLPSIWYEVQLTSPDVNVYGVAIPGAPCVIIGFNQKIAWGVTNASRDVKDWYKIQYADASKSAYMFDGQAKPFKKVVEEIKIKGKPTYYDTVNYTHFGPVTYDENFKADGPGYPVALRWTALDPSDELRTFFDLNRASNYNDYIKALAFYQCPGQNFAFASVDGDIAIKEQGKFVAKWNEQGKFIRDGTSSKYQWQAYIPTDQNPTILNPERGFISSANQHPTDATYPYYYNGRFEYYRNQRINQVLAADSNITVEDMMHLQNDNMNLMAKDIVPYMVDVLSKAQLSADESKALEQLKGWDFVDNADGTAPAIFQATWDTLYNLVWDEFEPESKTLMEGPSLPMTVKYLKEFPNDSLMDIQSTPERETAPDLIKMAFKTGVAELAQWKKEHKDDLTWSSYKATKVAHWARIDPFSVADVHNGGYKHIVNATDSKNGPSWRMIVSLEKTGVKAWAIYPGGQSGNPGSPFYANRIPEWANGQYHQLHFLKKDEQPGKKFFSETFQPAH